MNGSGKQSFYEIQLNNGSLIAAFLVAVALGVAVFMLGVVVGRGQVPPTSAEMGGVVEELGTAEAAGTTEAGDPDFFDKVQESDEPTTTEAAAPEREPVTEPAPTRPAATGTDTLLAGLPPADPSLATGYVIQVKSTPDRADADALQGQLAEAGFPAWVIAGDVQGRTTYRVRVGRYRNADDAEQVAVALRERGDVQDTWVTRG